MNDWLAELLSCDSGVLPFVVVDAYRKLERSGVPGNPARFLREAAAVIGDRQLSARDVLACHLAASFELFEGNSAAVERLIRELLDAGRLTLSTEDISWLSTEVAKYGFSLAVEEPGENVPDAAGAVAEEAGERSVRNVLSEVHLLEAVPAASRTLARSNADIAIVCALDEEFDAFETFFAGTVEQRDGRRRYRELTQDSGARLVLVGVSSQGNVRSALATRWAIDRWRPPFVILAGIAGGIHDSMPEFDLGDVVVPPRIVGYEIAKVTPSEIRRRIQVATSGAAILRAASQVASGTDWAVEIAAARPDGRSEGPRVRVGDLLSGEKIVADKVFLGDLKEVWPQGIAVEMEAIGLAFAAYESTNPPEILIAKAVCDWADPTKSDGWHAYACASSAAYTIAVCSMLEPDIATHRDRRPSRAPLRLEGDVRNALAIRLGDDWRLLANQLKVTDFSRGQWRQGVEGDELWGWASRNGRLEELPDRLEEIGRDDLAALFYSREAIPLSELR